MASLWEMPSYAVLQDNDTRPSLPGWLKALQTGPFNPAPGRWAGGRAVPISHVGSLGI